MRTVLQNENLEIFLNKHGIDFLSLDFSENEEETALISLTQTVL